MHFYKNYTILGLGGKPFPGEAGPLKLGQALITALVTLTQEEQGNVQGKRGIEPKEKFELGTLAFRIDGPTPVELSAEETALLKARVGVVFTNPVLVAALWNALEGKAPGALYTGEAGDDGRVLEMPRPTDLGPQSDYDLT